MNLATPSRLDSLAARARAGRWALAAAVVAPTALGASPVQAATVGEVRQELRELDLRPSPRMPRSLPARLRGTDASLRRSSKIDYEVSLVRSDRSYVTISRFPRARLAQDLEQVRERGTPPRRVTVGSRRVWYLCGHVCGYEWRQDRRTYGVFGIYYDQSPGAVERDMRTVVRRMRKL